MHLLLTTRLGKAIRIALLCIVTLSLAKSVSADPAGPLLPTQFRLATPQGFGDRQNSMAWSMQWWRGKLYIGTGRSYGCVRQAIMSTYFSLIKYPPLDPELECTASAQDLMLQGEIWRFTPESNTWERVYQSPLVPLGDTGKTVAVDVGYRSMTIFTESDGTEALYVGGFTSRDFNPGVPPPRILRTTDGANFEAVPQDVGTLLGDLDELEGITITGFNRMEVHKGRLYVIAGGAFGHGALLEAEKPADGNDSFQIVTPAGMTITGVASYNGQLYVAQGSNPLPDRPPFTVYRTYPTGSPPYGYIPVLRSAGYRENGSKSVATLYVFNNRLWVGTNRPVELLRINPDNSWDLIMGTGRLTPEGPKYPLSGIGDGFAWPLNIHIHQMQGHNGWLYAGTNDQSSSGVWHLVPWIEDLLRANYGFDLYATQEGWYFYLITRTGLERYSLSYSARTMASTPGGMYLGTMNDSYGLQLWRGTVGKDELFLPLLSAGGTTPVRSAAGLNSTEFRIRTADLAAPARLQLDNSARGLILSWEPVEGGVTYGVYRSDFAVNEDLAALAPELAEAFPGPFRRIASTGKAHYLDVTAIPGQTYQYYVVTEQGNRTSRGSNFVQAPVVTEPATVKALQELIAAWATHSVAAEKSSTRLFRASFEGLNEALLSGDLSEAASRQQELSEILAGDSSGLPSWRATDIAALMERFERRLHLARMGLIDIRELLK